MKIKLDKLPSLNEYIGKINRNKYAGNTFKKNIEQVIGWQLKTQCKTKFERIGIIFIWKEENNKRDDDNVSSAHKYIFDSMQKMEIIKGDGKRDIAGIEDIFLISKDDPGIEMLIYEYSPTKSENTRLSQRVDLAKKKLEIYNSKYWGLL